MLRGLRLPRGIPLAAVVAHFDLEVVTDAGVDLAARMVSTADLNRPGLQWAGYSEQFPGAQIQIVGRAEVGYLLSLPETRALGAPGGVRAASASRRRS